MTQCNRGFQPEPLIPSPKAARPIFRTNGPPSPNRFKELIYFARDKTRLALLLTGRPGVGKTTVLRSAARALRGCDLVGFYTEEIRAGRERRGFRLVTFGGEKAILAHVDLPPPRVSKYGVDVGVVDRFAATLQVPNDPSAIYLVDEIGKMECLSSAFIHAVRRLFERGVPLVATVAQRGSGFIEEVKQRHDTELWTITQATRETLPDRIVAWIHAHRHQSF